MDCFMIYAIQYFPEYFAILTVSLCNSSAICNLTHRLLNPPSANVPASLGDKTPMTP